MIIHNKYMKWIQELGQDPFGSLHDFAQSHCKIYKVTNVTKYRSFQYRLLQRGLVTNIQLYKWDIVEDNLCTFCHQEVEDTSTFIL